MARAIALHDKEAARLFGRLEAFIGRDRIKGRLAGIARELQHERRNPIYRDNWVLPNRAWWSGLAAGLDKVERIGSLRGEITPIMVTPLITAAHINALFGTMSTYKREEFATRILAADNLTPVLVELLIAAQFRQEGYEIVWSEVGSPNARVAPEFIAQRKEIAIEVECKTKSADAGRKILRKRFYRLSDAILTKLDTHALYGSVDMVIKDSFPLKPEWTNEVLSCIPNVPLNVEITLEDDSQVKINVRQKDGKTLEAKEFIESSRRDIGESANFALAGDRDAENVRNPTRFSLQSMSQDKFLKAVNGDIKKANSQLSGVNPGAIFCFLPEIQTFAGLGDNSGLALMTHGFLKHAKPSVSAVIFFSDHHYISEQEKYSGNAPAIFYFNPGYEKNLGDCEGLLREILNQT